MALCDFPEKTKTKSMLMATKLNDGSFLIQAGIDGPFEPTFGAKRIKSVADSGLVDPLELHQLVHGRPQSLSHADKQERIKDLIQEMRKAKPGLTFVQAWERLQKTRPELFDVA
jgi:hypothetical protein